MLNSSSFSSLVSRSLYTLTGPAMATVTLAIDYRHALLAAAFNNVGVGN